MMKSIAIALVLFGSTSALAEVRLPKILGSQMVLQRESDVKLWGWADPGEQVQVTCDWPDKKASVAADADG